MKELESPLKVNPDIQLIAEINKEYTLKGKINKQRGLILFGVDIFTDTVEQVKIVSSATIGLDGKVHYTHKTTSSPNLVYIWAINKERALYKAKRDVKAMMERLAL